ncbi:MAG: TRAP transporter small permease [Desulfobacterales bacterium]
MAADRTIDNPISEKIARLSDRLGYHVNWGVERCCALLMAAMVLVVWFGVVERYFMHLGATWTEEFSRYVMIWVALLAVSCGAYRREHIGLNLVMERLPAKVAPWFRLALDLVGLAFFLFLAFFGVGMALGGATQYATIFGITMVVPFASVPVAAGLTAFQILITLIRDLARDLVRNPAGGAGPDAPPGEAA